MNNNKGFDDGDELRRRAEAATRQIGAQARDSAECLSPEELGQTLHELHVHQIELEMQNEELRRAQVELEAVGTTPFAERGAVTDEYMDAMRTIWTNEKPVFHGR